MSIPPLVCSTPPPPDQCEDDKDHEDFDIQYHLSQDDDDEENYDFGNFATYNHFQASKNKIDIPVIPKVENEKVNEPLQGQKVNIENDHGTTINNESKLRFDEEIIEDLDLKLDQDLLEQADNVESEDTEVITDSPVIECVDQEELTQSGSKEPTITTDRLANEEFVIEPPSLDIVDEQPSYVDEVIAERDDLQLSCEAELPDLENDETKQEITPDSEEIASPVREISVPVPEIPSPVQEIPVDEDEFGDFDDFQFASTTEKPATVIDDCDNPWESNNTTDDGFGDFKASFDDNQESLFSAPIKHSIDVSKPEVKEETKFDDDDDFGDFDDFKSSSIEPQSTVSEGQVTDTQNVQLIFLPTDNESEMMEAINKVIYHVFCDEMPEVTEELEGKIESVLGETWGHLLQIDERQPYMVNWNNSLGQKTLLKALCIDSRNILFGPKWNYSMPKYAVNLNAAPLQPQKQATSSVPSEPVKLEKSSGKPTGTWSDPFTSEGQDSCSPDSTPENPVIEAGPTDLDVFEASTSSKPDKIYSSTLGVQPLRQINLPDTHIFTPTDSETPRSTTIHYDSSPPVLLPQTMPETSKTEPSFQAVSASSSKSPADDDYWEFQDFKGTSCTVTSTANVATEKSDTTKSTPNVSYGTQVLQPIKIEPIIPQLNWPDPGEVKETFDDFSDFVSSSTTSQPQIPIPVQLPSTSVNETDKPGPSNIIAPSEQTVTTASDNFDDDFDTFQSALPTSSSVDFNFASGSNTSKSLNTSPHIAPQPMTDFDCTFPKINTAKSDTISIESTKTKDTFIPSQSTYFPNSLETNKPQDFTAKSSPIQTTTIPVLSGSLLQPTTANTSSVLQIQQKSGQILQPLSLESYSQINWPNPGIDLQDLSRFNPVETLHSLKTDLSVNSQSKVASPVHNHKTMANNQPDDDWGDFVSSKPKPAHQTMPKKQTTFADDDEWTDFVSSPSVKPQNGLNTISFNVYTNSNIQKSNSNVKKNQVPVDIPTLNYITPKTNSQKAYSARHFQNL